MLRRKKTQKPEVTDHAVVLGIKPTRKRESTNNALEAIVFGGEHDIAEKLETSLISKKICKNSTSSGTELKPVWEDDDPTIEEEHVQRVTKSIEKWARLPTQQSDNEEEVDSDEDVEDSVQAVTGNCLAPSTTIQSGILQLKKCKDANADRPAKGKLRSVEFHPSARVMLTAGMDQTLRLFQIDGQTNPVIQSIFIEKYPIFCAHFSRDGKEVIMGSRHSSFYYYDMIAGKVVNVPRMKAVGEYKMQHFEASPDGKYLAFFGRYGHIHLITAQSKEWVGSVKVNGDVTAICFNSDASKMISHSSTNEVFVHDMRQRLCSNVFVDDGCTRGTAIAISPGDQYLATGSDSGVVNIYETSNCFLNQYPRPLKAIDNLTTSCTKMKFNSTAEILGLVSDMQENGLKLVHMPSRTVFSNVPDRSQNVRIPTCFDFSLNSGFMSVGNHKGQALLYRLKHYSNY